MGLLDGALQRVALGAFGSIILNGRITKKTDTQVRTDRGRIVQNAPPAPIACKAFYDKVTEAMRAAGYGSKDVRIVCLQLSPVTRQPIGDLSEGDTIEITQGEAIKTWRVAGPIDEDAAMAAWTFRGTPV